MTVSNKPPTRRRAVHQGATEASTASSASPALARLLGETADAVEAVRSGRSLTEALAACSSDVRAGVQSLSFHALRRLGQALAAREWLVPKAPPKSVDALLLTTLALAWPDGAAPYADHTLVDQAVTAARTRHSASAAFVNAVLRRFLREQAAVVEAAERTLPGRYNHPAWWVERLQADWPDQWRALLAANNCHPPMTLRVNLRQGSVADYLARLAAAGIAAQPVGAHGAVLATPCAVSRLPGFADGAVSVQDAAAQRAAPILLAHLVAQRVAHQSAQPPTAALACRPVGELRVLDACAAPGGKTAHLLEWAATQQLPLAVLALDHDAARLSRVDDTLRRLQLHATTQVGDAAEPAVWWDGQPFDAVLLDAPCTASGIVRRHPDVRWLRRPSDVAALAALQARLLDALWPLLKPGGRLLYCTCSVFKAEGQAQIDAFLQRQADACLADSPVSPGHLLPLPDNRALPATPPNAALADGFFYALLHKNRP